VLLGELSLDGSIHGTRGVLPIAAAARRDGLSAILLPASNAVEAAIVSGLDVLGVSSLAEAVRALNDPSSAVSAPPRPPAPRAPDAPDLADVRDSCSPAARSKSRRPADWPAADWSPGAGKT
jgi:magnesium chelatase family protein